MKYCTNCGHKINNNQSFCNNCGTKLHDYQSNQQSNHNKNAKVRGVNDRYTYYYRDNNQHKRSGFGKVLIAILAVVILGLLIYGLYFAYHQFISHNNSNGTTQSSNTSDDNAHGVQIDIFSDTFDQSYIKAPSSTECIQSLLSNTSFAMALASLLLDTSLLSLSSEELRSLFLIIINTNILIYWTLKYYIILKFFKYLQ